MTAAHKWYGPDPEWNCEKSNWVYDWISDGGAGMLGCQWHEIPDECLHFVVSQFARFNIPFDGSILDVARIGAYSALHWVDIMDPYALFWGISDVDLTQDWQSTTYVLHDLWGSVVSKEADPAVTESFAYRPGQAEAMFETYLARPGLEALPNGVGEAIKDLLAGEYNGEECWDGLDADTERALMAFCTGPDGIVDKKRMMAYFELAAWAGFLWIAGPLSRGFRRSANLIIDCAMEYGECLLIEGSIISPENYQKLARPPTSCYRCGVWGWCVELTQDGNTSRYICSHCLNHGLPPLTSLHCGTTFCRASECPHNPMHLSGPAGMRDAMSRHGLLAQKVRNRSAIVIGGVSTPQQMLSSG